MKTLKLLSVVVLFASLFTSCSDQLDTVYFYSKSELKNNLVVNINNEPLQKISSATLSLNSSDFFKENLVYLENINVTKICYTIKNLDGSAACLSDIEIFLDDVSITEDLDIKNLYSKSKNAKIEITNQSLLAKASLLLLNQNNVVFSYKSDSNRVENLDLNIEFSISVDGTFRDY